MHWRRKWQPLQCSCLESPRDGGAWWTSICGVEQSQTRLMRLSSSSSPSFKATQLVNGKVRLQMELCLPSKPVLFSQSLPSHHRAAGCLPPTPTTMITMSSEPRVRARVTSQATGQGLACHLDLPLCLDLPLTSVHTHGVGLHSPLTFPAKFSTHIAALGTCVLEETLVLHCWAQIPTFWFLAEGCL